MTAVVATTFPSVAFVMRRDHHSTTVFFDALVCEVGRHSSDHRFFHALLAFPAAVSLSSKATV